MGVNALNEILAKFDIDLIQPSFKHISQGYINDTYFVALEGETKFVLQRINSSIFKDIVGLHQNIELALAKLVANDYVQLKLYRTHNGEPYLLEDGNCWRLMNFIPNSEAHNFTLNSTVALEAGKLIGRFHQLLKHEDLSCYADTLPNLNYLPFHSEAFTNVLDNSEVNWKLLALEEVNFAKRHLESFNDFYEASLPHRVCHNDTKLNNFLFDGEHNGLCLIDLDTIMMGYFHYDFGDAVRTVVSETNEDERDLEKIVFNLDLFASFIDGISHSGLKLTDKEIAYLPMSCALMPYMHGLRALTDYLNGNIHYKVSYPDQNLDRCKSLFRFATLAMTNKSTIEEIIVNRLK